MTPAEYAEWSENEQSEDPQRCGAVRDLTDPGESSEPVVEYLEWCSKPWGHQYPDRGADIYHTALNVKGEVWLQWPDETEVFLRRLLN